jgi:hypothetical protein
MVGQSESVIQALSNDVKRKVGREAVSRVWSANEGNTNKAIVRRPQVDVKVSNPVGFRSPNLRRREYRRLRSVSPKDRRQRLARGGPNRIQAQLEAYDRPRMVGGTELNQSPCSLELFSALQFSNFGSADVALGQNNWLVSKVARSQQAAKPLNRRLL